MLNDLITDHYSLLLFAAHYSINDKLISDTPKTVSAPFKSTVERKMMKSPQPIPGPGSYNPIAYESKNNKNIPRGFL